MPHVQHHRQHQRTPTISNLLSSVPFPQDQLRVLGGPRNTNIVILKILFEKIALVYTVTGGLTIWTSGRRSLRYKVVNFDRSTFKLFVQRKSAI